NNLPHKNVETLIRAWGRLAAPAPRLVLCGAGFVGAQGIRRALAAVGGEERSQVIERAGLDDLVALYNGAELLASTSRYEGFCLPVVEAFACGIPVLAADAGAIPEIAGDAALLVPPERVDLITSEMYRLLVEQELRRGLVERGFRRAERFSWEEAARRTLAVYAEAVRAGSLS
ncbi:MAG: glycosyltransferase, partial [Candidatus Binatia bacterium]